MINYINKNYVNTRRRANVNSLDYKRAMKKHSVLVGNVISNFLLENSAIDPGKRKFKKINGERVQLHQLNGSLRDLHTKFNSEKSIKVCYTTFCKYCPKHCVAPKLDARDTCACITHLNFEFLIKVLCFKKVISVNSTHQVIKDLVCEKCDVNCFLRICDDCKNKTISFSYINDEVIKYYQWVSHTETRISEKTKKEIKVTITRKETFTATLRQVVELFNNKLSFMLTHELRIFNQAKSLKDLKKSVKNEECIIEVDFSENFSCKYGTEVQAVHYGANRQQITLHTGMFYCSSFSKGFVTASQSLQHDASAVIAHLFKILDHFLVLLPKVQIIHFKSDGPSAQYKNKFLFFLITQVLTKRYPQISKISYNYSESGHGKGPADGIGAAVKRIADDSIKYGSDIPDYDTFLSKVKQGSKSIHISSVQTEDIVAVEKQLPENIKYFVGSRLIYQFTWSKTNPFQVLFNSLSCFNCPPGEKCYHFYKHSLTYASSKKKKEKKRKSAVDSSDQPVIKKRKKNEKSAEKKNVKASSRQRLSRYKKSGEENTKNAAVNKKSTSTKKINKKNRST